MLKFCRESGLLSEANQVIRVPHLVKGALVFPPELDKKEIEAAFKEKEDDCTYVKTRSAQILREPVIDRQHMTFTGEYIYQVLPLVNPMELIEADIDNLTETLYALSFSEVLSYLDMLLKAITENASLVDYIRDVSLQTAEHPDPYHLGAFEAFPFLLSPENAEASVDNDLSAWGRKGRDFLDGWVEIDAGVFPGISSLIGQGLFKNEFPSGIPFQKASIRAMPTRQLHITAGNAPAIPLISMLRAILTKSAAVIKSPYGATLPGALIALAAYVAAPDHPITRNLSIVYWPGGDASIEDPFFFPNAFDRIVVWGAPQAVDAVRKKAKFTRTVCFNPRYGFSFIGKEAFEENRLREAAILASIDSMIWNQKACIASQVHYVEGTIDQAEDYAKILQDVLAEWDQAAPNFIKPEARGNLKRMKRGKYMSASWYRNRQNGDVTSSVVVMNEPFDMLDHPMCRLVVVRPVSHLNDTLPFIHHAVSSIGIYPEKRRLELRDGIAARGVSNVLPLGQVERIFGGMPHDGMMVLTDLVDWKNG
ncbi:MAG: hypothetical protein KKD44_04720 [Proteobacteria bacterium]|nr:hypothetical protein [Pseudomonadota bacterium]